MSGEDRATPGDGRAADLRTRAERVLPGGCNSPVRAHGAVGGDALVAASGAGATLRDVDGREFTDLVMGWGPLLFGHADPDVVAAVREAAGRSVVFGATVEDEVALAEAVVRLVPSVEMVRLVCSGTEACMSAVRLARAATGRDKVIKFAGCYHGHADGFLVAAGSGAATLGTPSSPGVPGGYAADTLVARYNDPQSVEDLLDDQVAAVIVEPVAGNMGCVPPADGFLEALRDLCDRSGALLIFDEVMTGFRVAPGGAQERFGVMPDLTCLGKVLGGGLPLAAYGGRRDLMEQVAPSGPVYQAGTLAGSPPAVAAGRVMLERIEAEPDLYDRLETAGSRVEAGLRDRIGDRPLTVQRVGSMFTVFFRAGGVRDFDQSAEQDTERFAAWHRAMHARGVHLPPSAFEACFLSTAHDAPALDRVVKAAGDALDEVFAGD